MNLSDAELRQRLTVAAGDILDVERLVHNRDDESVMAVITVVLDD